MDREYQKNHAGGSDRSDENKSREELLEEIRELRRLTAEVVALSREKEEARREAENQRLFLDRILESLPYPFYVIDAANYRIVKANPVAVRDGLTDGDTCYHLTHRRTEPCNTLREPCPLKIVRETGKPAVVEHVHYDHQGNERNVEVYGYPIFDSGGRLVQMLEYSVDVTERRQRIEELKQARNRALQSEQLKTAFLANMSHEIRTPMNAVLGYTDLLRREIQDPEHRQYLDIIHTGGRELLALLDDILDLSKIEAGHLEIEWIPCSLETIFRDLEAKMAILVGDSPIQIRRVLPDYFEKRILCDPYRLLQVMNNLLSNAIKFTEEGFIEYGVTLKDFRTLEFYVRDTGVGISPDRQEEVFEPFRQQDVGTTRKYGGTGLGLTITRRLIRLMGGEIFIQSSTGEGHGSCFYFTLPYHSPVDQPGSVRTGIAQSPCPIRREGNNKYTGRVLLAEDNEVNRTFARRILEKAGFEVAEAIDGREAISMYKSDNSFSLILMDIQMPVLDGLESTRVIRQLEQTSGTGRPIPIIALTASAMKGDRDRCLEAGCSEYLPKPFRLDELEDLIAAYIETGATGDEPASDSGSLE